RRENEGRVARISDAPEGYAICLPGAADENTGGSMTDARDDLVERNRADALEFCQGAFQQSFGLSDERTREYAKVIAELMDHATGRAATRIQQLTARAEAAEASLADLRSGIAEMQRTKCGPACHADDDDPNCLLEDRFTKEIQSLRASLAEAERVMEPFAAEANQYDSDAPDYDGAIAVAHLRAARAWLDSRRKE